MRLCKQNIHKFCNNHSNYATNYANLKVNYAKLTNYAKNYAIMHFGVNYANYAIGPKLCDKNYANYALHKPRASDIWMFK